MTTEMKNYYEQNIEKEMINYVCGDDEELRQILLASDSLNKRARILAQLQEMNQNRSRLFNDIIKITAENKVGATKHIRSVVKMLRDYVEFGDVEVKTMGEVMTPIELVEKMLRKLPAHVWSDKNLKWLDPCNGVGIFVSVIVDRLMKGLSVAIPNEEERYKHIMEKMIYVGELQPKNMFLFLYAFDPHDKYALNIHCGSYLTEDFNVRMNEYGVDKFDVIVMNPPYQSLQEGNTKSQALWNLFVKKALNVSLKEDGYLVAVHPSGWRNVDGMFKDVQMQLKSRQMSYLEIHNEKDGLKTFGAETRYDFYCVKNTENLGNFETEIMCQDGTVELADLSKMEFIPNGMYDTFQKLIAKNGEETVKIINNSSYHHQRSHMNKIQTEEFKYPCVYTVKNGDVLTLWYSNINTKGHFGIPKLIWSSGRIISVGSYVDKTGEYGLTEFGSAIVDDVNVLDKIKQAFDTKEFRALMEACSVSDMSINRKVIATFRKDFWVEFL